MLVAKDSGNHCDTFWFNSDATLGLHYSGSQAAENETLPHSHAEYEIRICLSGECEFVRGQEAQTLRAGDVLVISPGQAHQGFISQHQQPYESETMTVVVSESTLNQVLERMSPSSRRDDTEVVLFPDKIQDSKILQLVQSLTLELEHRSPGFDVVIESQLRQVLVHLLRNCLRPQYAKRLSPGSSQLPYFALVRVLQYMRRCPESTFNVERLCKEVGMSRSSLTVQFRNSTAMSVRHFYVRLLMKDAMRYLKRDDCSVKQVAYELGFKNLSHFSRVFRSLVGTTPSSFSQMNVLPLPHPGHLQPSSVDWAVLTRETATLG